MFRFDSIQLKIENDSHSVNSLIRAMFVYIYIHPEK
jgi:hypothetical protein